MVPFVGVCLNCSVVYSSSFDACIYTPICYFIEMWVVAVQLLSGPSRFLLGGCMLSLFVCYCCPYSSNLSPFIKNFITSILTVYTAFIMAFCKSNKPELIYVMAGSDASPFKNYNLYSYN